MPVLAAYRLELKPAPGQSPQECLEQACAGLSDMVVKYYRGRKLELLSLRFDGQGEHPKKGHRLVAARNVCAQHSLATLEWELEDSHYVWQISCVCAADHRAVEVQYRFQLGLSIPRIPGRTAIADHSGHRLCLQTSLCHENLPGCP